MMFGGPVAPSFTITAVNAETIAPLREWHQRAMACQIVRDSFLRRGFCDSYAVTIDTDTLGYALVDRKFDPGTVIEFYVMPETRASLPEMFRRLIELSGATGIRAQTNDRLLVSMLYDTAIEVIVENVLFADGRETRLANPGGTLERKPGAGEEWHIVRDGQTVAEGGLLFHYNPPYADIFMEVHEAHRRRGYGSYLIQELKRVAYALAKLPAARCNADNDASRRALEGAGMFPCGRILRGTIRR